MEGDWSTPDVVSCRLEACIEEDIGGELEYDEEDVEEEQGEKSRGALPAGVESPQPLKISRHIGLQSFTNLAMVGKGGFGKVCICRDILA